MTVPIRTCIGCQRPDEKSALLRLVADPAGRLKADRLARLPGRGAYVHPRRACIVGALRGAFGRAFKRTIQPVAAEELTRLLGLETTEAKDKELEHEQR